MRITTRRAARFCCISEAFFSRVAKLLGWTPIGRQRSRKEGAVGRPMGIWSGSQVISIMMEPMFGKFGVATKDSFDWCQRFGRKSDEQLEAELASGRTWVVLAQSGGRTEIFEHLLAKESVERLFTERAKLIDSKTLQLVVLDVSPLWAGISEDLDKDRARYLPTESDQKRMEHES